MNDTFCICTRIASRRKLVYGYCFHTISIMAVVTSLILYLPGIAFAGGGNATTHLPQRYVLGRLLIHPRPGLSQQKFNNIISHYGGHQLLLVRQIDLHVIELPQQANTLSVMTALSRNPNFKFVEPDGLVQPVLMPDDPDYVYDWHLPKIGAPNAWDTAQGKGITIAILDSGVDTTHPDLQGQLVPGWNFYDGNDNVSDVFGHGTAVAGIAAAATNNNLGVASVSFKSKIMPMRITDTNGYGYYSLMAQALTTAADNGARVANISFLGVSLSSSVDLAAQYMRSKGGVVVIAGGNTGGLRDDPPSDALTAVAATDTVDGEATFSSWGDYIDISAPGVSIRTTKLGGDYGSVSGTSASSPIVAGVYALMMSANPSLQPATLDSVLFDSALDLGPAGTDPYFGAGRVQADIAVTNAIAASSSDYQSPSVAITSPTGGTVSGLVPVDVTATDNTAVAKVELYVNDSLFATDAFEPYGFTLDSSQYAGTVNLQARAYDNAGNSASSNIVLVTVASNSAPPQVAINSPIDGSVVSGTVTIIASATDDDGISKMTLSIDGKGVGVWNDSSSISYQWSPRPPHGKGKKGNPYSSTISVTAEDTGGNSATATATVTVTK